MVLDAHKYAAVSEKGRRKAGKILDAAATIIVRGGAENFSMNRVAAEAGISLGNLQYYFPKRKDLVWALLERQVFQVHDEIARVLSDSKERQSGESALLTIVDYIIEMNESVANCSIVWNAYSMSFYDESIQQIRDKWFGYYVDVFVDLIKDSNPSISKARRKQIARCIVSTLEGEAVMAHSTMPDTSDYEAYKRKFANQLLSWLRIDQRLSQSHSAYIFFRRSFSFISSVTSVGASPDEKAFSTIAVIALNETPADIPSSQVNSAPVIGREASQVRKWKK